MTALERNAEIFTIIGGMMAVSS